MPFNYKKKDVELRQWFVIILGEGCKKIVSDTCQTCRDKLLLVLVLQYQKKNYTALNYIKGQFVLLKLTKFNLNVLPYLIIN